MSTHFKSFIIKILIATTLLFFSGWVVFSFISPQHYITILPYMLIFFSLFTLFLHAFQLRSAKKNQGKFTRDSMLASLFRLFAYSVFALIYIASKPDNAAVFVVSLVIVYLVFNFIEIRDISIISRKEVD